MATARTFKLSENINLNVGNKQINIMKDCPRALGLESKVKIVKIQETSKNASKFSHPLEDSRETRFLAILAKNFFIR